MNDFYEFKNEIIKKLKESGLIEKYTTDEFKQTPSLPEIIEIFEELYHVIGY